jgi:hypothetical protein
MMATKKRTRHIVSTRQNKRSAPTPPRTQSSEVQGGVELVPISQSVAEKVRRILVERGFEQRPLAQ